MYIWSSLFQAFFNLILKARLTGFSSKFLSDRLLVGPCPCMRPNMAASCGAHCILNLAPVSCLTSAFCGHHAPWSLCHGVFALPYSHIASCSIQNPPRPEQSPRHPSPPLQACAEGNFSCAL